MIAFFCQLLLKLHRNRWVNFKNETALELTVPRLLTISWIGIYFNVLPLPNSIHNSFTPCNWLKTVTEITITSLSTVLIKCFENCFAAWLTCSNILSSTFSILQGLISSKFKNSLQRTLLSVVATTILYSLSPSIIIFQRKGKSSFLFWLHRRNVFQLLGSIPFSVTFRRTPVLRFEQTNEHKV